MNIFTKWLSAENDSLMVYIHRWNEGLARRTNFCLEIPYLCRIAVGDTPDITSKYSSHGFIINKNSVMDFVAGPVRNTFIPDEGAKIMMVSHWGESGTYVSGTAIKSRPRFTKPVETTVWICTLDNGVTFDIPMTSDPVDVIKDMIELGALMRGEEPQ